MKKLIVATIFYVLIVSVKSFGQPSLKYLPPGNAAGVPSRQYLSPHSGRNLHYTAATTAGGSGPTSLTGYNNRHSNGAKQNYVTAATIPIVRQDYTSDASGNYNFGFETANGIQRDETGDIHHRPESSLNVQGSYSYTGDDGRTYTVNYKADENGFHAEGDHLPTTPAPLNDPHVGGGYGIHGAAGGGSRGFRGHAQAYGTPTNRYLPPQQQFKKRF